MMERDVVRTQVYGAFGFLLHQLSTATQEDDTTMSEDDTTMSDADARAWSERTAARWRVQRAREGDITMEDGIGDGIRLIIDTPAGRIYDTTLIMAALAARAGSGEITPFLYRDPIDPDEPNAPRPLRRAVLAITDDKIVPTGLLGAEGAKGNEPEWSAWNDPNNP